MSENQDEDKKRLLKLVVDNPMPGGMTPEEKLELVDSLSGELIDWATDKLKLGYPALAIKCLLQVYANQVEKRAQQIGAIERSWPEIKKAIERQKHDR